MKYENDRAREKCTLSQKKTFKRILQILWHIKKLVDIYIYITPSPLKKNNSLQTNESNDEIKTTVDFLTFFIFNCTEIFPGYIYCNT